MKQKSRKQKFMEKYNTLIDKQKEDVAVTLNVGIIKNKAYSWNVVYFEVNNDTKLASKMLNRLKHNKKI